MALPQDLKEKADALQAVIGQLSVNDQKFADSLLEQLNRKGALSEAQWLWVGKLADRVNEDSTTGKGPGEVKQDSIPDFESIWNFFQKAYKSGIQWPVMRMDGCRVLGRQGSTHLRFVCEEMDDYGKRKYLGKIDSKGILYFPAHKLIASRYLKQLSDYADQPAESMKAYGRRTGTCCLCGRTLTNHASIEAGIGPICAGNWGI